MQNTMLDSATSCIPSTLNFVCDVDGVHTEIPIPPSAWDFENETVWLTQAQLAELYKTSVPNICLHIGNILEDDELQADSTIKESLIVQLEGNREVSREVKHYNLEMLIALGYRIRSKVATKFRQWATKHLKELMTKGRTELQPMSDAEIMSRALEIAHRTLEAREERIKALTAERDEAIRTKYHFVEGRDAKVCGELGGLRTQNEALRKQIGDSKTHKAVTAITWLPDYFDISNRGIYIALAAKLKKLEAEMPPKYAHTDIQDSRWGSVKAYHVAVIERLHEMVQADENLMKKYRKIASV